ncbi:hypothetical protein [Terribacillus saccharophilus]|uniref:hypothetical protein n=1 Tax=Terribacillus saccharophilus TaxID=361277 RepID=UPI0039823CE1
MFLNKRDLKKLMRYALLLYSILIGLGGTISIVSAILIIPKEELPYLIEPFVVMGIFVYGSCAIALFIRAKFFNREKIK